MKRFSRTLFSPCVLLAAVAVVPATAATIDFDSQASNRGGNLTGIPDSPLTIATATFTGGELLLGEVGLNADPTGVYASEGLFASGETNPLVITFAVPVQNFSIFLLNGDDARSYTVTDNLGDSVTNSIPSAGALGTGTFSLPGTGLTAVAITSANSTGWDFAIDDVTFTDTTTVTPEPEPIMLSGAGLLLLITTIGVNRMRAKGAAERWVAPNTTFRI
jgi:hypothetical protein